MSAEHIVNLNAFDAAKKQWRVIIETPKGSHNKYTFDEELRLFMLNGVLPEGMSFPYDFGFLPSTRGEDGDPLDVLVLMDEPAFCGCLVPSRLIGVIEAQQTEEDGTTQRNDRLIAVPIKARTFNDCKSVEDLNEHRLTEIQEFFVSYNRIHNKKFKVLGINGVAKAEAYAKQGMHTFAKEHRKGATSHGKAKGRSGRKK